jgi:two-component system, NarL family, nitrate/nitrite response regulator NarL
VRWGLRSCLARHKHLHIVGEAADGAEAVSMAKALSVDLVLIDIDMPKLNGPSAAEILRRDNPKIRIVILSDHDAGQHALRILKSGAHGCVSKQAGTDQLIEVVETVIRGGTSFDPEVAKAVLNGMVSGQGVRPTHDRISPREREVLLAMTDGLSNKEIASRLEVTPRTVETHRERMMRKLNLRCVADLTRFAIAQGLIPLPTCV